MGRILEELYSGDLQPAENRNWDDPEYEVKCEASLEEVHAFCDGFRIGARMMWEVFGREATGQSAR